MSKRSPLIPMYGVPSQIAGLLHRVPSQIAGPLHRLPAQVAGSLRLIRAQVVWSLYWVPALVAGLMIPVSAMADALPKITRKVPPEYPRAALKKHLTGTVRAHLTVDGTGKVTNVSLVEAAPSGVFDEAVTTAVRQWQFEAVGKVTERDVEFVMQPDE